MRSGVIEQVGTPLELYNRPGNLFVAGFIGSPRMNFLTGEVRGVRNGTIEIHGKSGMSLWPSVGERDAAHPES